jgi:hypothetical protein
MSFISLLLNETNKEKNKNNLENDFKLPIEFIENKTLISDNIIQDLEFKCFKNENNTNEISDNTIENNENNENNKNNEYNKNNENNENNKNNYKKNLYYSLFNPVNNYEKKIIDKWSDYYTNNKDFLQDTQKLLKDFKNRVDFIENIDDDDSIVNYINNIDKIEENYSNITYDDGFIDKYQYIDLPIINKYNNNKTCLLCLSIYNLFTPAFSLLFPLLALLMPFFIIKMQGHKIDIANYLKYLKLIFSNHVVGQLFTSFSEASISTKLYLLFSVLLYIFQIYQNIVSCTRYFNNISFIHNTLFEIKNYLQHSLSNIRNLLKYTTNLKSYKDFNEDLNRKCSKIECYLDELNKINPYNISVGKLIELGNIMHTFYKLYDDDELTKTLYFTFDCNGYITNINNIQKLIKNKNVNYCNFIDKSKITSFNNIYYGNLLLLDNSSNIVKNKLELNNNLILTGPNAAGKTTLLKSILFNIILCQQVGCGFFESANVKIYDYIHCCINIPDTSNRDSLFQAEARQCKEILNIIENNTNSNHLCVFDELYSGTNPEEAVNSGFSYLSYLNKNKNVNYILTTHYVKLCKKLNKSINVHNYHMQINQIKDDFEFTYKLKKGISKTKGASKILKDLEYPEHILNSIKQE